MRTALRGDAEKVVFGDRDGRAPRPKPTRRRPQGLCLDRGYDYDEVRALVEEFGFTCHIRSRGEERVLKREAGSAPGAGWSSARTPGFTASAASSCVGRSGPTRTWRCFTSHAALISWRAVGRGA